MSDFSDLMAAELHRRVDSIPVQQDRAVASVRAGIRRRRTVRAVVSAAAAAALVGAVGIGSYGVYSHYQAEPAITVSQSPSPAPTTLTSPTPGPSATPQVTISASPSTHPGKTITEYPPAAASRGAGFPDAYQMRDWVWDYVGEGWSLQSFSVTQPPYAETTVEILPAVIYLVSPDGKAFELLTLPAKYSEGLTVWSWQEDSHGAHIEWKGVNGGGGYAELNLDTGDVSPIVFTTPWGKTSSVRPLAISGAGDELWEAYLGTHVRYYRFSPVDGWTVSTLNGLEGADDTTALVRWQTASYNAGGGLGSPDGAAVVFERHSGGLTSQETGADGSTYTAPQTPIQILIYDVNSDSYFLSADNLNLTSPNRECYTGGFDSWKGGDTVVYDCAPYGSGLTENVRVPGAPDHSSSARGAGAPTTTIVDNVYALTGTIENSRGVLQSGYVGFGEPPVRSLYEGCSC